MSITEEVSFDKDGHIERFPLYRKLYLALVIVLVAGLAFGIGRLTGGEGRGKVSIEFKPSEVATAEPKVAQTAAVINTKDGGVYASKNGTKYYYMHCGSNVSEKNKITFATASAAEAAGYTLAANCKP